MKTQKLTKKRHLYFLALTGLILFSQVAFAENDFTLSEIQHYIFHWDIKMCQHSRLDVEDEAQTHCLKKGNFKAVLIEVLNDSCDVRMGAQVYEYYSAQFMCVSNSTVEESP